MQKLNDRLYRIAEHILAGETMADIGTDHGFLPIYLLEQDRVPKAIFTDISRDSLEKARNNAQAAFPDDRDSRAVFRQGDGIRVLRRSEASTVVIAGMGGLTMISVLEAEPKKTVSFARYIFQPRNNSGKLRFWLEQSGFSRIAERLAEENGNICEILVVEPPRHLSPVCMDAYPEDSIGYEVPEAAEERELLAALICRKLQTEQAIVEQIRKNSKTGAAAEQGAALHFKRMEQLREMAERLEGGAKQ